MPLSWRRSSEGAPLSNNNLEQMQQLKLQGTPTEAEVIAGHIRDFMSKVHVSMPGEVVKFYDDGTADVQPLFMRQYFNQDDPTNYKPIPKVPVIFPGPANGWLRFPLQAGDPVALIFAERSLDKWWSEGGQGVPSDRRMFHLSDAFCIPGLRAQSQAIDPKGAPTSMEMAFGNSWFEITQDGRFKVTNGAQELFSLIDQLLGALQTAQTPIAPGLTFDPGTQATLVQLKTAIETLKG